MAAISRRVSWVCKAVVVGAVVVVEVVAEERRASGDVLGLCFFLRSRQSSLSPSMIVLFSASCNVTELSAFEKGVSFLSNSFL